MYGRNLYFLHRQLKKQKYGGQGQRDRRSLCWSSWFKKYVMHLCYFRNIHVIHLEICRGRVNVCVSVRDRDGQPVPVKCFQFVSANGGTNSLDKDKSVRHGIPGEPLITSDTFVYHVYSFWNMREGPSQRCFSGGGFCITELVAAKTQSHVSQHSTSRPQVAQDLDPYPSQEECLFAVWLRHTRTHKFRDFRRHKIVYLVKKRIAQLLSSP